MAGLDAGEGEEIIRGAGKKGISTLQRKHMAGYLLYLSLFLNFNV